MDDSFAPDTNSYTQSLMRSTVGERLPDGTVLEPVAVGDQLQVCRYSGGQVVVEPLYKDGNVIYLPPQLDPTLYAALRFPHRQWSTDR